MRFDGKEGGQNYSTAVAEHQTNTYVSALIGEHLYVHLFVHSVHNMVRVSVYTILC